MTNKELQEKLEKFPDDMEVWNFLANVDIEDVYEKNHYTCGEWKTVLMID